MSKNTIINNNNCYSNDEINTYINKLSSYSIITTDNLANIKNYKNPLVSFFHRIR